MCGIYGFIAREGQINPEILPRMGRALAHRGPDDGNERIAISDAGCVALGHKRLSIIDLSAAGRQPMANEDESIWLTLNGEIYNHQELRQEL
ncbi:MAG TPA: asparagine synthetase B, partial [Candidatus Binatia bacterium]|nr:asparagine synthetase B [Candidatus Binatia bacterium]